MQMQTMTGRSDGGNIKYQDPPVVPILQQHVDQLSAHSENVSKFALRLHALADRVMGQITGQIERNGEVKAAPSPSDSIGRLEEAQGFMQHSIAMLDEAVKRLEAL